MGRTLAPFRARTVNRLAAPPVSINGTISEGAMLEMIIAAAFAGFGAVVILGHVMLLKAIMTPDRA
jgi:hypothetical protein